MNRFIFFIAIIILFASCRRSPANSPPPNPAFGKDLPAQLKKGINLSNWFNDYSDPAQYATRFTAAHFTKLKQLGFTYLRIPIGNTILFQPSNPSLLKPWNTGYIDSAIAMANRAGLAVMINYHPLTEDYEKTLYHDPAKINELAEYWKAIATYFKKYTREQLFFEIYNEPHAAQVLNASQTYTWWWPLQQKIVQAIRTIDNSHFIIAGNEGWNNIEYLSKSQPYTEPGIIYNFHFYEPFVFTHQGADWVGYPFTLLHDVPYPSSPEKIQPLTDTATNADFKDLLTWYGNYRFNSDTLYKMIKVAADWAAKNNVPLICNEFGAYKTYAPAADRAQCIHDMRSALESLGIGWAMWECDEGFGLLYYTGSNRDNFLADDSIKDALGL